MNKEARKREKKRKLRGSTEQRGRHWISLRGEVRRYQGRMERRQLCCETISKESEEKVKEE